MPLNQKKNKNKSAKFCFKIKFYSINCQVYYIIKSQMFGIFRGTIAMMKLHDQKQVGEQGLVWL